jgi:predicted HTH domain antitoxin
MKNYLQISQDEKEAVINLYYERIDLSFTEMAILSRISRRAFVRVLKEAGINTRRKNRYTLDETFFSEIDTPIKSYLVGLLAADGCVAENDYIALQMIDIEALHLFKDAISYSGEIREIEIETNFGETKAYRINFSSNQMASNLRRLGISANTQLDFFPEIPFIESFLLGYFDGDGSVYCNKDRSGGSVNIIASKGFCESLQNYFGAGSLAEHDSGMWYWRIFAKEHFQKFNDNVYKDLPGLSRKNEKLKELLEGYKNENNWAVKSRFEKSL